MKLIRIAQVTIVAAIVVAAQSMKDDPGVRLRAAIEKESVDGDLKAAIKQYGDIVARYRKTDRAVAATALVRMAEAHQKLGNAEARKLFEQVLKDFADQKEAVAQARAALGRGAQAGQQVARLVMERPGDVLRHAVSISFDGRYIAFPDWDTGNLTLHDVSAGADRPLTDQGTWAPSIAYAEESAFSRDGKQVAFNWYRDKREIYDLRVAGLPAAGFLSPRVLFTNDDVGFIRPNDWSPDNKLLAVTLSKKDDSTQIGLISTHDGSLRVLKSVPRAEVVLAKGFSLDGKYLLYTHSNRGSSSRAYLVPVEGTVDVPLVSGPSSVYDPVWTPDGSRIVFVSDRGGSPGLWSIRVGNGKPLGEPELLKTDFRSASPVGFARDGSLFYTVDITSTDIYLADLDPVTGKLTSKPRRINQRSVGNSTGRIAWLPDGKSLSFWNRRGERNALVVHTLASGEEREVPTQDKGGYTGWFPDGRSYMSQEVKVQSRVFRRINASTGEARATWTVPDAPPRSQITFSPDLMTMFFTRKDDSAPCEQEKCTYVVAARELQTGRDREVFRIRAREIAPLSVSPDGQALALVVIHEIYTGERSLMIAPIAGGPLRELHRGNNWFVRSLAWTKDGSRVLAPSNGSGGGQWWSFPAKGGSPEKFPRPKNFDVTVPEASPAVSPDGTQIAFVGSSRTGQVWVMSGLLPDGKTAGR